MLVSDDEIFYNTLLVRTPNLAKFNDGCHGLVKLTPLIISGEREKKKSKIRENRVRRQTHREKKKNHTNTHKQTKTKLKKHINFTHKEEPDCRGASSNKSCFRVAEEEEDEEDEEDLDVGVDAEFEEVDDECFRTSLRVKGSEGTAAMSMVCSGCN